MKKLVIAFLTVCGLAADASAQCGSQTRFPRTRAFVARFTVREAVFPRLRAIQAQPRLVGLSGGCLPVIEYPAQTPVDPAKQMPPVVVPSKK